MTKVAAKDTGHAVERSAVKAAEFAGKVSKDTAAGDARGVTGAGKAVKASAKGIGRLCEGRRDGDASVFQGKLPRGCVEIIVSEYPQL